jgi:hypothetical protein
MRLSTFSALRRDLKQYMYKQQPSLVLLHIQLATNIVMPHKRATAYSILCNVQSDHSVLLLHEYLRWIQLTNVQLPNLELLNVELPNV